MYDKVIAFGDSFVSGDELSQELIPNLQQEVINFFGVDMEIHGDVKLPEKKFSYADYNRWRSTVLEKYDPGAETAKKLSYAGQIADHYNAEFYNFAYPGFSMSSIYATVIKNLSLITPDSLVIVGLTFPDRITRFRPYYIECEPGRRFSKNKDHAKYIELDVEYGNDIITRLMWVQTIIESIKSIVKCKRIIFIDPVNIYRENPEIEKFQYFTVDRIVENHINMETIDDSIIEDIISTHLDIITYLKEYFNRELFPYTFAHSIERLLKTNQKVKCILGHPSYIVHRDFVENCLIPEL